MTPEILITNACVFSPDKDEAGFFAQGFVAIGGGRILDIGAMSAYKGGRAGRIIDAGGALVMPGLVNGHNHAAMTLFRGLADDLPLMTWLEQHIFPAEARYVGPEMVYWCTKLAAAEMLLSGTTTVADAYFYEDEAARAFSESGMRAVAAHGIVDFPAPGVPDPADNVAAVARFIERHQGDDLVHPAVFAHSPYTCSSKTLVKAKELARQWNVPFFIHLAETHGEQALIRSKWQGSPTSYLHSLGILDEQTICVHGVWLDEEDIALLARTGACVVSCPQSNMKLASGVAPLAELRAAGVPVCLGTDGCASNNGLDMFAEMDMCAKLHKVHSLDPTTMPAREVLKMATAAGAHVLGLRETGVLAPGKQADLILVDHHHAHLTPFHSIDTLVYAANGADVKSVIVNGRLVVEERDIVTFDVAETMQRVAEMARTMKDTEGAGS